MTARTLTYSNVASSPKVSSNLVTRRRTVKAVTTSKRAVSAKKGSLSLSKLIPTAATFSAVAVFAIAGMVVYHLVSTNASVAKGFELKKLQKEIATLTEKNKRLVVQQAEAGSINKVQEVAQKQGLVQTKYEEYLNTLHLTQR